MPRNRTVKLKTPGLTLKRKILGVWGLAQDKADVLSLLNMIEAQAKASSDPVEAQEANPRENLEDTYVSSNTRVHEQQADTSDTTTESISPVNNVNPVEKQSDISFNHNEAMKTELEMTPGRPDILSDTGDAEGYVSGRLETLTTERNSLTKELAAVRTQTQESEENKADLRMKTNTQLETLTRERDSLTKELGSTKSHTQELEGEKKTLQAQVVNLEDKITDMNRLRQELTIMNQERQHLSGQLRTLSSRLEDHEGSREALEEALGTSQETVRSLHAETGSIQEEIAGRDSQIADLRVELDEQLTLNGDIIETRTRLEKEIKMLNISLEHARHKLKISRRALCDIRNELTMTSERIRQRNVKPQKKETVLEAIETFYNATTRLISDELGLTQET